jgi:DNA-binding transcriptional LysR family regulator
VARNYYYKSIQLPQLRSFCVAATEENFAAAARILGLSAATVWEQVRALERKLATSLLRRRGREVELTAEGRLLLELIQPHVSGLDSLEQLFATRRSYLPQPLAVAATDYSLACELPKPIQEFSATHPSVQLSLTAGLQQEVLRRVERGEADLGVIPRRRDEPRGVHLEYEELFERPFVLVTATSHPLARKRRIGPRDLVDHALILPPKEGYSRMALDAFLQREMLADKMRVVLETRTMNVACQYAALGVGITLAYAGRELASFVPGLHLRSFDSGTPGIPVDLVVRKGAHLSEPALEFCRVVRRLLGAAKQADDNSKNSKGPF